jgi:hypothetical protein
MLTLCDQITFRLVFCLTIWKRNVIPLTSLRTSPDADFPFARMMSRSQTRSGIGGEPVRASWPIDSSSRPSAALSSAYPTLLVIAVRHFGHAIRPRLAIGSTTTRPNPPTVHKSPLGETRPSRQKPHPSSFSSHRKCGGRHPLHALCHARHACHFPYEKSHACMAESG